MMPRRGENRWLFCMRFAPRAPPRGVPAPTGSADRDPFRDPLTRDRGVIAVRIDLASLLCQLSPDWNILIGPIGGSAAIESRLRSSVSQLVGSARVSVHGNFGHGVSHFELILGKSLVHDCIGYDLSTSFATDETPGFWDELDETYEAVRFSDCDTVMEF